MFTGIVEQIGSITSRSNSDAGTTLTFTGEGLSDTPVGASIAINGVCLTATVVTGDDVSVDVVPETLERTNLGRLVAGSLINIERPMPATGRFDGHIVQGHVDGVGDIVSINSDDNGTVMTIRPPEDLLQFIVEKGSITVDGVSLTVAGLSGTTFDVALIPHTLDVTTLGLRKGADAVNLEVDVLAKYVERLLEARE